MKHTGELARERLAEIRREIGLPENRADWDERIAHLILAYIEALELEARTFVAYKALRTGAFQERREWVPPKGSRVDG